jgi:hypothetical protein
MEILKASTIVKQILIDSIETRDSDELLTLKVWAVQKPELRNENFKFRDFANDFMNSKLFKTESITRARRKIQEEIPSLRGYSYKGRQNEQESVKQEIKDLSMIKGGTP